MLGTINSIHRRGGRRIGGLVLVAALAAAAAAPAAADPSSAGRDPGQPGVRGHAQTVPAALQLQVAPVHQVDIGLARRSLPGVPALRSQGQFGADEAVDQALGQLPTPVLPGGGALASAGTGPVFATTEYFCSDADGVSLPANKDSECPQGTIKVSVTTCEAGEECNL